MINDNELFAAGEAAKAEAENWNNQQNYFQILEITCSKCKNKTTDYFVKNGEWWDSFLEDDEQLCPMCMKEKIGFVEMFEKLIHVTFDSVYRR